MTLSIDCCVCFPISQSTMSVKNLDYFRFQRFNIGLCNLGFFTVPQTPCLSNGICISCYTKWNVQLQQLYSRMARYSRPGQGCLSLTILPPIVHPPPQKKRAKLKLESKNKLTIFITCLFPILFHIIVFAISSSYLPICSYHFLF